MPKFLKLPSEKETQSVSFYILCNFGMLWTHKISLPGRYPLGADPLDTPDPLKPQKIATFLTVSFDRLSETRTNSG